MAQHELTATEAFAPFLRHLHRLAALGPEDEAAVRALPYRLFRAEERALLTRVGDLADDCCLLVSAYAYKQKVTREGGTQILAVNLPGEILNLQHALSWPTDFDSKVWRAGTAASIPGEALRELIFENAAIARALWLYTHAEAALYREWLLNVGRRDLTARLAHLLSEISVRLATLDGAADPCLIPVDADQLAQAAGSVPLYVARALAALEAQGILARDADGIRIGDASRLAAAGDFRPDYLLGLASFAAAR